jgi:hypothetical protein
MPIATDAGPTDGGLAEAAASSPLARQARDLRLDFFRGLALWFIYLDHIPNNAVSWITLRNYGFSDAAEAFVFISGYAATVAYAGVLARRGWLRATAQIARRVWQLYVAHILLFVAFTAQIAWFALRAEGAGFLEEMNLLGFVADPTRVIVEAALLRFRPVNLDVLPLYIVLLAVFPLALPPIRRAPWLALAGATLVYLLARRFDWNLSGYPDGKVWYFDPFAWQLLFFCGAAFAADGRVAERLRPYSRLLVPLAVAYLAFAAAVALSWQFHALSGLVPDWLGRLLYPIDKTTLDPLRLAHFLALAYLVQHWVPADARFLGGRLAAPVRCCGRHSLPVFCIGTFLSFSAQAALSTTEGSFAAQLAVSAAGIAIMVGAAYVAAWYRGEAAGVSAARPGGGREER